MADNITWFKITSWHVFERFENLPNPRMVSYCGLRVAGAPAQDRDLNEKTCESCLRLVSARMERG
jgi:hypothetical protein